jgi:3-hydroxyisobutyrate dehydrogenase
VSVGWAGTGEMGAPMCARLLAAGTPVSVWNRTRAKADALASTYDAARVVDTVEELAAEVVLVCVTGAAEVAAVLDALLAAPRPPSVVVNCSTVTEADSAALRATAAAHGVALVAAPVSASASMVATGGAAFAVSGPDEACERVRPLLRQIGGSVVHAGPGETALLLKLCSNVLMSTFTQSLFELARVAEAGGVESEAFFDFVAGSPIGSAYASFKGAQYLAGQDRLPDHQRALMQRDVDDALAAGAGLETPMPLSRAARELV